MLVRLTFNPQAGHEQRGRRPALILSPRVYNSKARLAIACPITSQVKGYPFEVPLPPGGTISGVVLADHVKNLDWQARGVVFEAKAPSEIKPRDYGFARSRSSGLRFTVHDSGTD